MEARFFSDEGNHILYIALDTAARIAVELFEESVLMKIVGLVGRAVKMDKTTLPAS